jgi:hypothetical protein
LLTQLKPREKYLAAFRAVPKVGRC